MISIKSISYTSVPGSLIYVNKSVVSDLLLLALLLELQHPKRNMVDNIPTNKFSRPDKKLIPIQILGFVVIQYIFFYING